MKIMIVPLLAVLCVGCVGKVIVKMPPPGVGIHAGTIGKTVGRAEKRGLIRVGMPAFFLPS
jgi:hypothetical protein